MKIGCFILFIEKKSTLAYCWRSGVRCSVTSSYYEWPG